MNPFLEAIVENRPADALERLELPGEYVAAHLRAEDTGMFHGTADKDVRKSLRVGPVAMPEPAPDEVVVAVMASSINYNTVWSATFEPVPTFEFLRRYGAQGGWAARHDQPFQVVGSDAAGVVVRTGSNVRRWRIGDHVVVHPVHVDEQEPVTHEDAMLGTEMRAWGYETNYGGLGEFAVARASMLVPKPPHLTWEEAAVTPMCGSTAYRMLVGRHGARMKQGDVVLVWGAAGGLGAYAVQFVRNGGGIPVAVVGSARKAEAVRRLGCEVVIDRSEIGLSDDPAPSPEEVIAAGKRLGGIIRRETGRDPDIVFEHVGRATFGISVFVAARGGTVVTCGSSTGYHHEFDNRYLWMRLKRVIGSHGANLQEQAETGQLVATGAVSPTLSALYPLAEVGEATRLVQRNEHVGKVGVLCLAPEPGLGVTAPELRARIGADRINPLRDFAPASSL
ncbi:crotonyl-CoA carboxylase/reductase [Kitasatospora aureofaciens]|uniref:crotonyl-CoA carboxylase/reductase n=1 Tax=Kitasatospora aureofaciens TaxID=1894 RepID=UPI0005261E10|nr:crotonyl-CoA carboxylase/reductase [Kitasatospora aureofaciens]